MTIAIIGAMSEEIDILQKILHLNNHYFLLDHIDFFQGTIQGEEILLVRSGIGKVSAATATTVVAERYKPRCIINVGILGALRADVLPSSLILPKYFVYHDVDVTSYGYRYGQVPKFPETFAPNERLQNLFEKLAGTLGLTFYIGPVLTGDRFVDSAEEIAIMKQYVSDAIGVEMESTAIAQVAYLYEIPMGCIRSVSDFANEESVQVSEQNLVAGTENVAKLLLASIGSI